MVRTQVLGCRRIAVRLVLDDDLGGLLHRQPNHLPQRLFWLLSGGCDDVSGAHGWWIGHTTKSSKKKRRRNNNKVIYLSRNANKYR
jgi:hypothetical protein